VLLDCDLAYGLWPAKYPGQKHVCSKNDTDTKEDMDMHGRAPCPGPNNSPGAIGARHAPHAARPARTPGPQTPRNTALARSAFATRLARPEPKGKPAPCSAVELALARAGRRC
jgi:hypothetical protein